VRYRGKAEFAHWYFNETTQMKYRIDKKPAGVEGWLEQRIYYRKNGRYFAAASLCKTQTNATEGIFKCKIRGDTGGNPLSVNINRDDCHPHPCGKGTCNDEVRGYTCTCPAGYRGVTCEIEALEKWPTDVMAEVVSSTNITVTWNPPTDTSVEVMGYKVSFKCVGEKEMLESMHDANDRTFTTPCCAKNIKVATLMQERDGVPASPAWHDPIHLKTITPVNATAVNITWTPHILPIPALLKYKVVLDGEILHNTTYSISANSTSFPLVLDDSQSGSVHNFTLEYCDAEDLKTSDMSFVYDETFFQIQFGPIMRNCCRDWGEERTSQVRNFLHSLIVDIIREGCNSSTDILSEKFLRQGTFFCDCNPNMITYRTALINPSPTSHNLTSADMVQIIQEWVREPSLEGDIFGLFVNPECPTIIEDLMDSTCANDICINPDQQEVILNSAVY
jgi:hypothetical protein